MKIWLLFAASLFMLTFISCSKESSRIKMGYLETHCADPWIEYGKKKTDIKKFFRKAGVIVRAIDIYPKEDRLAPSCRSCGCYSGNEIELTVFAEDTTFLKDHGFYMK
jgi:hypothetical protein